MNSDTKEDFKTIVTCFAWLLLISLNFSATFMLTMTIMFNIVFGLVLGFSETINIILLTRETINNLYYILISIVLTLVIRYARNRSWKNFFDLTETENPIEGLSIVVSIPFLVYTFVRVFIPKKKH